MTSPSTTGEVVITIEFYFKRPRCLERLRSGPLGIYIDQYAAQLHAMAFAQGTGKHKVRLVASLSRWLQRRRLTAPDLDDERCLEFLRHRARTRIPNEKDRIRHLAIVKEALVRRFGHAVAKHVTHRRALGLALAAQCLQTLRIGGQFVHGRHICLPPSFLSSSPATVRSPRTWAVKEESVRVVRPAGVAEDTA